MTRLLSVVSAAVLAAVAVPSSATAPECGFSCTVGQYLDLPDDAKMRFIESHATTSRRSRNPRVQECVEGLSDDQIRIVFETYVEAHPETRINRATGIYAQAIGACDMSRLPEAPAEPEIPAEPEPEAPAVPE